MQAPLKYIFSVGLISVVYEGLFIKKMVSSSPKITRFYIQAHKQRERNLRDTDWIEMSLFTASNGESALEVVLGKCQMSPSSSAGNCGSVVASQLSYKPYSNLFEFYSNLFSPDSFLCSYCSAFLGLANGHELLRFFDDKFKSKSIIYKLRILRTARRILNPETFGNGTYEATCHARF